MLRDNLVGLIEPMLSSAGANPLALCTAWKQSSDDRPPCLENPRPEGAESTLTENAASPFHAEPKQLRRLLSTHSCTTVSTVRWDTPSTSLETLCGGQKRETESTNIFLRNTSG